MIVATHTAMSQGHGNFPPTPSAGGNGLLTVDGHPVILVGQSFVPHTNGKTTHTPVVADGSDFFTVDGIPVATVGSSLGCGDTIASSATQYFEVEG